VEHAAERPVLAIDLGGTQIRAALITPDLAVHARRAEPTRDEQGVDAVVARICEMAAAVVRDAERQGLDAPFAIGISSPGPLDASRGIVLEPPNLSGWRNVPLADRVGQAVGLPAFLERDTNVALMAEWRHGAARGTTDAVYLTVSTGIGGAAIIGGRPLVGPWGTAGEAGHLTVQLDGPTCGCGGIGHVEAIASGVALARDGEDLVAAGRAPRLAALARGAGRIDAELVARAAEDGDPECTDLLEHAWAAIGALCASLVNLLNPEVIVIGGSIAEHHPLLIDVARREVERNALPVMRGRTRLEPARLGPDVSLIGVVSIVHERIGDRSRSDRSHRPRMAATQQGALRP
jgi:glucokinase